MPNGREERARPYTRRYRPWEGVWPVGEDPSTWVKVKVDQRPGQKPLITVSNYWYAGGEQVSDMVLQSYKGGPMIEERETPFEFKLGVKKENE